MKGTYRIYSDGVLLAESENMITTQGAKAILRYLAGDIATIAGAIGVGTSGVQPALSDTRMGFEFARGLVDLSTVDFTTNAIYYKAPLPAAASGVIYEVGLFPQEATGPNEFTSVLITGFEPSLEPLTGGTENFLNYRIGASSYQVSAVAEATATASLLGVATDFSGYGPSDVFSLAFFTNDANAATIRVRLYTDAANYYTYTFTPNVLSNYYVVNWYKSDFVATGNPNWSSIATADFSVIAAAGGPSTVQLDGFRVSDTDFYPEYALVSRSVIAQPIVKRLNQQMDIQYVLEFNA